MARCAGMWGERAHGARTRALGYSRGGAGFAVTSVQSRAAVLGTVCQRPRLSQQRTARLHVFQLLPVQMHPSPTTAALCSLTTQNRLFHCAQQPRCTALSPDLRP